MKSIYLDYNATTPIAPIVIQAMQPFLTDHFGNPSSLHSLGRAAAEAIEDSRGKIAGLLGCDSDEIIFTGGGTEANNLAIKGMMFRTGPGGRGHLVISAIEHPSVNQPAKFLERLGYDVSVVGCDEKGIVNVAELESALRDETRLVSIMHANNEIGTIQPIRKIAHICHSRNIPLHTDASQSVGKIATLVDQMEVDMLTIAGHKFYGPKGVGALYLRSGLALEPLLHGASHERGLRAGTENTPSIVALGAAAKLSRQCLDNSYDRLSKLRDRFTDLLREEIPDLVVNGEGVNRLPNTLSVSFPGVSGQEILGRVPELQASTFSACHSGAISSPTLTAMGVAPDVIKGTVRLSLGWYTSQEDIDRAASLLIDAWEILSCATSN